VQEEERPSALFDSLATKEAKNVLDPWRTRRASTPFVRGLQAQALQVLLLPSVRTDQSPTNLSRPPPYRPGPRRGGTPKESHSGGV